MTRIVGSLVALLLAAPATAAVIYVSPGAGGNGATPTNPASLSYALYAAGHNQEDDVIYAQAGTYDTSTGVGAFYYEPAAGRNDTVRLLGGWDAGFTSQYRGMDPLLMTALDGNSQTRVLEVTSNLSGVTVDFTIENVAILNGKASDVHGAGLRLSTSFGGIVRGHIRRCLFKGNRGQSTSPQTSGGGMYSDSWFEATDSVFSDNAATSGGAMHLVASPPYTLSPIVDRCSFDNNATLVLNQGGADINNTTSLTVRNSRFRGKDDGSYGGGGAINHVGGNTNGSGMLTVINSVISGKKSCYWGAGIHIWDANARIVNTLFVGNTAGAYLNPAYGVKYGRGGGIAIYDPNPATPRTVEVLNCTFVKNRSEGEGDCLVGMAIDNRVETLRVVNSIFWDNSVFDLCYNKTGDPIFTSSGGATSVAYSDVQYGYAGGGNIDANPGFADFAGNDFHLTPASPCRNAGTSMPLGTFLYELYPTVSDLDGRYRMIDGPDMGAYELDTGPYASAVGRGDPAVAHDPENGSFLTVYAASGGTGGGSLYGRLVGADGVPLADEFAISEQESYERLLSAVAYDPSRKKFFVVWDTFNASSNDTDVLGQLVKPDGSLDGWNLVVSDQAGQAEMNPAVASGEAGQAFVVWERWDYVADDLDVVGRLFQDGVAQGTGEIPIATDDVEEGYSAVAYDGVNDRFFVVWADNQFSGTPEVYSEILGRRFDALGSPVGTEIHLTGSAGSPRPGSQWEPAVAFNPAAQHFLVAWTDDGGATDDVHGRIVDADGTLPGAVFPVSTAAGDQGGAALACVDEPPRFLAVWHDGRSATTGYDVRGAWFHEAGSPVPAEFVVVNAAGDQGYPAVAGEGMVVLAAWETRPTSGPLDFDVDHRALDVPPSGTVTITLNGVDAAEVTRSTAVKLLLQATADTTQMCVSNTASCSAWTAFSPSKNWTLPSGSGPKRVSVWFRDQGGNKSLSAASDTILLDTVAPVNGTVTATPGPGRIELGWDKFGDALSGIDRYKLVFGVGTAPASCAVAPEKVLYEGKETSYSHEGLINQLYGYRVCAIDGAGNVSTGAIRGARPLKTESDAPAGTVEINEGAAWTNRTGVRLELEQTPEDASPPIQMCVSNTPACTVWKPFASTMNWTLAGGNGPRTVYVWFRDTWLNTSATPTTYTDTIGLDTTRPVNGTLTATAGAGQVELAWQGFREDASATASGIDRYLVVWGKGTAPATCVNPAPASVVYEGTETSCTHKGLINQLYGYRVCAIDGAGNVSTGAIAAAKALP